MRDEGAGREPSVPARTNYWLSAFITAKRATCNNLSIARRIIWRLVPMQVEQASHLTDLYCTIVRFICFLDNCYCFLHCSVAGYTYYSPHVSLREVSSALTSSLGMPKR